jgi:hypothetical protein
VIQDMLDYEEEYLCKGFNIYMIPGSSFNPIRSAEELGSGAKSVIHISAISHSNLVGERKESYIVEL